MCHSLRMNEDDADPVVSEIPIYLVQPPNKQQIHVYQYPLRPKFRQFQNPGSVVYYPSCNQLYHNQAIEMDQNALMDDPNAFSSLSMLGNSLTNFQENANYALAHLEGEQLLLQPVSEIYQIKPDFSYINDYNEKDIKPLELDENQQVYTITSLQGTSYCYRYVTIKPTKSQLFSEISKQNIFNIPSVHYKNLFISEQNVMSKLYRQLQQVKDIRRKCEIITTKLQVFEIQQARKLLKGTSDAEILLASQAFNYCVMGVFAVCSKFCIEKKLQLGRDLALLMIALGGSEILRGKGDLLTVDVQQCLEEFIAMKPTIFVDRVVLALMSKLECYEISYIFELKNLVVCKNGGWAFGYNVDYQYVSENLQQMVHEAQRLRDGIVEYLKYQTPEQPCRRKAIQVIREY